MKKTLWKGAAGIVVVAAGLLLAGGSSAESAASESPQEAATAPVTGLRVVIDPDSGRVVSPTAADKERFALPSGDTAQIFARGHEGLEVERLPDGSRRIRLGWRLLNASRVDIEDQGLLRFEHARVEVPANAEPSAAAAPSAETGGDR